jgi:hypothetical protein
MRAPERVRLATSYRGTAKAARETNSSIHSIREVMMGTRTGEPA